VNLSGLEFGGAIPGRFQKDYTVPTSDEVDYFVGKDLNVFRLPFRWERLQEQPNTPLNDTYLGYIDGFVKYATGKGAYVLLDVHNYARYYGKVIGTPEVPASQFANLWQQLADHFKDNELVFFGLMNEPHDMHTEMWLADANAAIAAIRSTGAKNLITVPGNGWTGAWSWYSSGYGTPNAQVMLGVKDPLNNFIFEVHQYMDSDGSGTHPECVNGTIGAVRLNQFTGWARQHGYKAMVGEWAGAPNSVCFQAIASMASYMAKNDDVYAGWTWWSAGPWWGKYMFNLDEDQCGKDAPQMQYLTPSLCPKKYF
jgi:endoglucanase